jgi:Holliday junction resolvase
MVNKNSEKYLEKKLREEIRLRGGIALKYTSPYITGIPDRIVLMPNGKIYFIELKSKNKKPTEIQKHMIEKISNLSFYVRIIDDMDSLESFFNFIDLEQK